MKKSRVLSNALIITSIVVMASLWSGCIIVDDDEERASMRMTITPSTVTPVFDAGYREWRWYFDIIIDEGNDVGLWLDDMSIRFYDLNGVFEYETDFTSSIGQWFGSTWLPPSGTLRHLDAYWHNNDGSPYGWQAVIRVSGVDQNGYRISTSAEVICLSGQQSAAIGCSFSPPTVPPVYDYQYGEYRWYLDWSVFEDAGIGVQLTGLIIDFFDSAGYFEESVDYTSYLTDWFGTTWLPGYGLLVCRDRYWINSDGSGRGWKMKYTYYGRDASANNVQCSGWVTLLDASYYRAEDTEALEISEVPVMTRLHSAGSESRERLPEPVSADRASRLTLIDGENYN